MWDTTIQKQLLTYDKHTQEITTLAWSPDGRYIASGSADHTVHVWDALSGVTKLIYKGHKDAITALAWSPDGKKIISGSQDNTAQIWTKDV